LLLVEDDPHVLNIKSVKSVQVKVLPRTYYSPVGIEIYGEITCFVTEDEILRLENLNLSKRMKMYFDSLWKIAKTA
jgi:hypothetical protein